MIDTQAFAARLFRGRDRSRSRTGSRSGVRTRRFVAGVAALEARCLLSGDILVPDGSTTPLNQIFWNGGGPTDPARPPASFVPGINVGPITPTTPKTITITNASDQTIYPLLQGVNTGRLATAATPQNPDGYYDPQDNHNEEYRAYIGYVNSDGQQALGLPAHSTIEFLVPLVFWDSERTYIVTDGADLIPEPANLNSQNPFHYDPTALRGVSLSTQPDSWVQSLTINGAAATGLVMFYHAQVAQGIGLDAPAQLTEFTIRDPYLTHWLYEAPGHIAETTVEFNYDVSYVDSLTAPVAMEATQVPIAIPGVTDPPRADYGWAGSELIYTSTSGQPNMRDLVHDFINNSGAASIGEYFGGQGWPAYYNPNGILNIPSGANIFANSPLNGVRSSYDTFGASNQWMLSSGGIGPIEVQAGGVVQSPTTLRLNYLKSQAAARDQDYATLSGWISDQQDVRVRTLAGPVGQVQTVVKDDSDPNLLSIVVTLAGSTSLTGGQSFIFSKPATDRVITDITNLWYSWANYYLAQFQNTRPPGPARGTIAPGTNLLTLNGPVPLGLAVGMTVSGQGIVAAPGTSVIILDIATVQGQTVIHLSQLSQAGGSDQYDFGLPAPLPFASPTGIKTISVLNGGSGFTPKSRFPVAISGGGGQGASAVAVVGDNGAVTNVAITGGGSGYTSTPTLDFSAGGGSGVSATVTLGSFVTPYNLKFTADQLDDARLFGGSVYAAMAAEAMIPNFTVNNPLLPAPMSLVYTTIGCDVLHLPNSNQGKSQVGADVRDLIKSILRGVYDFNQVPESQWYPHPATWQGGLRFNAYNLDPYVWFVHEVLGLSGYGFSVDDDTSDVGAYASNYTPQMERKYPNHLDIVFSGLKDPVTQQGVNNLQKWYGNVQYGPITAVGSISTPTDGPNAGKTIVTLQDQTQYWQIMTPDSSLPGAFVVGQGVPPGTRVVGKDFSNGLVLILSNPVDAATNVSLTFTGASPENPFANHGFEKPFLLELPPNNQAENLPDNAWTFSNDSGIAGNQSALTQHNGPAPQGKQVLWLANRGRIRQRATLVRGTYELSFYAARRQRKGSVDKQAIRVFVDGELVGTVRPSGAHYTGYRVAFRVASGQHTITLAGTDGPGENTVFLDAISLRVKPRADILARLARIQARRAALRHR